MTTTDREQELRELLATMVLNRAIERLLPEALKPFVEDHGRTVDWLGMSEYVDHANNPPTLVASMGLAAHIGGIGELVPAGVPLVELLVSVPKETRSEFATSIIMLEASVGI